MNKNKCNDKIVTMLELKKIQFMLFLAKSSSEKSQPGEIDTVNV